MFVSCKIDGEQQGSKRLSFADLVNLNEKTDRCKLAERFSKMNCS